MACKCETCGSIFNGSEGQMVMLRDDLWLKIAKKKEMLCASCIERRLGRKISAGDLKVHNRESFVKKHGFKKILVNKFYAKLNGLDY